MGALEHQPVWGVFGQVDVANHGTVPVSDGTNTGVRLGWLKQGREYS